MKSFLKRSFTQVFSAGVLFLISTAAYATETDQYFAWNRIENPLKDSLEATNAKINDDIQVALASVNRAPSWKYFPCYVVVGMMVNEWSFFIGKNWPELWGNSSPLVERLPETRKDKYDYKYVSLYGPKSLLDWGVIAGAAPTIRINGVNIGTDKLGHHFVEGGKYYRVYHEELEAGKTPDEAEKAAIDFGISLEKGKLGLRTSGVFSNGDLESNYQGFRFYRNLCEGGGLKKTPSGWILKKPYDAREYVNLDWDESLNGSTYKPYRWNKVKQRLKRYCSYLEKPEIAALKKRYRERPLSEISTSVKYLTTLIAEGKVLDPALQSLEAACSEE